MNNPLEAVTQAVNSLVTALKLPDESAKANEVLGEMSFPQFSRLLPYRDYNQESGLFMNRKWPGKHRTEQKVPCMGSAAVLPVPGTRSVSLVLTGGAVILSPVALTAP